MMATSTSSNDRASARVSSRRQQYKSVTPAGERLGARRVLAAPGRGAFAMITNTQSLLDCISGEDFIKNCADLAWRCSGGSCVPEIIAHYQAEDEPPGTDRPLQRTADLRLSDTRVIAHWDFNHAEASQSTFQDHFNRPAVGILFENERTQYVRSGSTKRAEIGDS